MLRPSVCSSLLVASSELLPNLIITKIISRCLLNKLVVGHNHSGTKHGPCWYKSWGPLCFFSQDSFLASLVSNAESVCFRKAAEQFQLEVYIFHRCCTYTCSYPCIFGSSKKVPVLGYYLFEIGYQP